MLIFKTLSQRFTVVNQYYEAEVVSEYVIKGNTAVLKCTIPSFVADFLRVEAWVASDGTEYIPQDDFGRSPTVHIVNHKQRFPISFQFHLKYLFPNAIAFFIVALLNFFVQLLISFMAPIF